MFSLCIGRLLIHRLTEYVAGALQLSSVPVDVQGQVALLVIPEGLCESQLINSLADLAETVVTGKIKDVRRSGNHQRILQQYEYNARRQITGVVDGNRNPISYDVDSWGRITGIGFADGVKEGYEYTPAGRSAGL